MLNTYWILSWKTLKVNLTKILQFKFVIIQNILVVLIMWTILYLYNLAAFVGPIAG